MAWSLRLGAVRGIELKVHITFVLILFIAAANWSPLGPAGVAFGIGLMLLLFGCVTLHELGHAIAAQGFGVPVREIILLPIGGVALLGRNPRDAWQELVIAAAGPAVNVVIALLLIPVLLVLGEPIGLRPALLGPQNGATLSVGEAVRWLVGANVSLVLFNLIPAFPLDGGRILRGLLGLRMGWTRATRWATSIGQAIAIAMAAIGFMSGQLTLVIIALLVYFSAAATDADERARTVLGTQRVGDACNRYALSLTESDRLSAVVRYLLTSYQPDYPVMRGREFLGVVLRRDVLTTLQQRQDDPNVTDLMTSCPRVDADQSLADVRSALEESAAPVASVYDGRGFLGLVSLEDLREAEMILRAQQRAKPADALPPRPLESRA